MTAGTSGPPPGEPVAAWRAGAYGMELTAQVEVLGLSRGAAAPSPGAPQVDLQLVDRLAPASGPRTEISASPYGMKIDVDPAGSYRMTGSGVGEAQIDPAAAQVTLGLPGADRWLWNRWVLSQVLPFVAGLHGVELLHAGGVVLDRRAVAIVGPSGAGKSTLVSALVDRGASFLTDDVVALAVRGADVIAHPGPGLLVLGGRGRPLAPSGHRPVGAVCVIESAPSTGIEAAAGPDPRTLLGNVYERVRRGSDRLEHQLGVLGQLADQARFVRVRRGPDGEPDELARALITLVGSG